MEEVLHHLLGQDNGARKLAESQLLSAVAQDSAQAIGALLDMCIDGAPHLALLSAMLLRKFLGGSTLYDAWPTLSSELQERCKATLLQLLVVDMPQNMRVQVELCISSLGARLLPESRWATLMSCLLQGAEDPNSKVRASTLHILSELFVELCDSCLQSQLSVAHRVFSTALAKESASADTAVCFVAIDGILSIASVLEADETEVLGQFAAQLPTILDVLARSVNDPQRADFCVEVLDSLVLACEHQPSLFKKHQQQLFTKLLEFLLGVAFPQDTTSTDERVQCTALELVLALCEAAPAKAGKIPNFVPTLLGRTVIYMVAHIDAPHLDTTFDRWGAVMHLQEDDEYLHTTEYINALTALQRIADTLASKQLYKQVQSICSEYLPSADWRQRLVALTCLSQMAEGLSSYMKKDMASLAQAALQHLHDAHPYVRSTAIECCLQFSMDLPGFPAAYQAEVVPALANLASTDPYPRLQSHCCTALSIFYTQAQDGLCDPLFTPLTGYVLALMETADKRLPFVVERAVGCLGDIVKNASADVVRQAYPKLCSALIAVLQGSEQRGHTPGWRMCSAECIERIAELASAVGRDGLQSSASDIVSGLTGVLRGVDPNSEDPRTDALLHAFGSLAETLREEFAPYVDSVLGLILMRASRQEQKPQDTFTINDSEVKEVKARNTTIHDEKVDALELLGDIGEATGSALPEGHRVTICKALMDHVTPAVQNTVCTAAAASAARFLKLGDGFAAAMGPPLVRQLCAALQLYTPGEGGRPHPDLLSGAHHSQDAYAADEARALLRALLPCISLKDSAWLTPEMGTEVTRILIGILYASSDRDEEDSDDEEDEETSEESDEDDDDEDEDEDDSSDDSSDDTPPEDRLRAYTVAVLETLLVKQPQLHAAVFPGLGEAFVTFISSKPALRELGLSGAVSLMQKGHTAMLGDLVPALLGYLQGLASSDTDLDSFDYECLSSACACAGTVAQSIVSNGMLQQPHSQQYAVAVAPLLQSVVSALGPVSKGKNANHEAAACVTYATWGLIKVSVLLQQAPGFDMQQLYACTLAAAPLSAKCFDCDAEAQEVHAAIISLAASPDVLNQPNKALLETALRLLKALPKGNKALSPALRAKLK